MTYAIIKERIIMEHNINILRDSYETFIKYLESTDNMTNLDMDVINAFTRLLRHHYKNDIKEVAKLGKEVAQTCIENKISSYDAEIRQITTDMKNLYEKIMDN
jgi:hypothetical protein